LQWISLRDCHNIGEDGYVIIYFVNSFFISDATEIQRAQNATSEILSMPPIPTAHPQIQPADP